VTAPHRPGLVLVLVGAADRRMLPALHLVPQLDGEARALHVAVDPEQAAALAAAWVQLGLAWLPLELAEPGGATVAAAVRNLVVREAAGRPRVTVLVPELDLRWRWQLLLHRGCGREIAWHLQGLRRVVTAVLPVPVDLAGVSPGSW